VTLSPARVRLLVVFVALAAYATSLGNGFAYDDNLIIARNPVVTEGQWGDALLGPYWHWAGEGSGLYRPVTVGAYTAQWALWGGRPLGFHAVNVALHVGVSLLVLELLLLFVPVPGAAAGALLFAVHPVHVEAVANVVGFAELVAAAAVLAACLLYLRGEAWSPGWRAARLAGLSVLYVVGLGAKEIAVTLPGLLVLLELYRRSEEPLADRLRRLLPVLISLTAVLGAYLVLRASVLGTVAGEVPAPALRGLSGTERVLTALTVWPEYLRLMVFPLDLSADYAPAVLLVSRTVDAAVLLGAGVLVAWLAAAAALRRRAPVIALGMAWFVVAVLPVSNLLLPAGVLLAERTLYLPSVGVALVGAGLTMQLLRATEGRPSWRRRGVGLAMGLVLAGFMIRTVLRVPAWLDTYTVLNTLAAEHPESYLALRGRASGLDRVGEKEEAARYYELAVRLAPRNYALLVEAAEFYGRLGRDGRGEQLLRQAMALTPDQVPAYQLLAEQLLREGKGREAHRVALEGIAHAGPARVLWDAVSEAYVARGDLEAAVRARRAALGLDPTAASDWRRLADLLDAQGRIGEAARARAHSESLDSADAPSGRGDPL
jgi:tetratricopeptide (TPR) repeat protein